MSKYAEIEELETLAKAIQAVPNFGRLMYEAAWTGCIYEGERHKTNQYIEEHKGKRPTRYLVELQASCSRKWGEYNAYAAALKTISEAFGLIHSSTIYDEIEELSDCNSVENRRRILQAAVDLGC